MTTEEAFWEAQLESYLKTAVDCAEGLEAFVPVVQNQRTGPQRFSLSPGKAKVEMQI